MNNDKITQMIQNQIVSLQNILFEYQKNVLGSNTLISNPEMIYVPTSPSGVTMNPIRYQYISTRRRRYPIIVAYTTSEDASQINVTLGASFCHESDQFSRPLGREIAEGRMNRAPFRFSIPYDRNVQNAYGKTVAEGLRDYVENYYHQISVAYSRKM